MMTISCTSSESQNGGQKRFIYLEKRANRKRAKFCDDYHPLHDTTLYFCCKKRVFHVCGSSYASEGCFIIYAIGRGSGGEGNIDVGGFVFTFLDFVTN